MDRPHVNYFAAFLTPEVGNGLHRAGADYLAQNGIEVREPHATGRKGYVDGAWLREQYLVLGRPLADLGREKGLSPTTTTRWAKLHGIPARVNGPTRPGLAQLAAQDSKAPEILRPAFTGPGAWDRLREFAALSRYGTLKEAAEALGTHHTALITRVGRLRREIGHPLLIRATTASPMKSTPIGEAVVAAIHAAAEPDLSRRSCDQSVSGGAGVGRGEGVRSPLKLAAFVRSTVSIRCTRGSGSGPGSRSVTGSAQYAAIKCGTNPVESLHSPVAPVGRLVVSAPAPGREHRPVQGAAPLNQVGEGISARKAPVSRARSRSRTAAARPARAVRPSPPRWGIVARCRPAVRPRPRMPPGTRPRRAVVPEFGDRRAQALQELEKRSTSAR